MEGGQGSGTCRKVGVPFRSGVEVEGIGARWPRGGGGVSPWGDSEGGASAEPLPKSWRKRLGGDMGLGGTEGNDGIPK